MIEWITTNFGQIIQAATQIVGTFAIIAAWTPNTADNKIAATLLEAVNFLGFNLNKAKNSPEV